MQDRDAAAAHDARDELAPLRELFDLPRDIIYLDGNSLGVAPRAAAARARDIIGDEWANKLIRSWNVSGWYDMPRRLGDRLAPLIGAAPAETVVTDTISINLFKVLSAALRVQEARDPARRVIVSERSNFPSDLYIAEGVIEQLDRGYSLLLVDDPSEIPDAVNDATAVVMLTHVNYRTGYMHDMKALTGLAHARKALSVWDLAHSAGAVEIDLNDAQADYAVGCTYKYLNGGPGSPGFVWVAKRHQASFNQPLSGWWGHKTPFAMTSSYQADPGIARFLCGTQPIISMALIESGLDIFAKTTMQAVRRKSVDLTTAFVGLVERRCGESGLTLATPRDAARRGSHVSFEHENGYEIMQALIERGVIGDYREPRILRFGFTPLYSRFVDVWDAVEVLRDILVNETWRKFSPLERTQVT
ncbi:MAG: kynureninase [Janthinobacterium lividum]